MKTTLTQKISDYLSLMKLRLSALVILTAACGAAVAPDALGQFSILSWFYLISGTVFIVGAANAMNCFLERDVDALMERTADRPLVTGRMAPVEALFFSVFTANLGLYLLFQLNLNTMLLGFLGYVSYVAIYTPMKRKSMGALFTGAIPGAIPPLMGWAAVENNLGLGAWILFGILFVWQLPHFIAISLFRQSEYDNAGLKTVPGTMGAHSAMLQMIFWTGVLGIVSVLPAFFGLASPLYFGVACLLSVAFLIPCLMGLKEGQSSHWIRTAFFGSLAYLPIVLGMWVIDQRIQTWLGN
ncbi:protoheme IX farnesyltransferase [bacterium]|nr:protoheme IX farnesyltransferase [bacterium]